MARRESPGSPESPPARLETAAALPAPGAPATVVEALAAAARTPEATSTGLRFLSRRAPETRQTWAEVAAAADLVAQRLVAAGIERGDRVAIVYRTEPDFLVVFFGILAAGAVATPLYPPTRLGRTADYARRTAAMLQATSTRLVLAPERVARLLGEVLAIARPELGCRSVERLLEDRAEDQPSSAATPATVGPEDLALVQFSSGTTGAPKPVALSHRALLYQGRLLHDLWPDSDSIRHSGLSWLPLYHDMGLIGCVLPALLRPGDLTLMLPEDFVVDPAGWLRAISQYRATVSAAPNFAYAWCLEKVRDDQLGGVDLSHWRSALIGAETVSPRVLHGFAERFARYGLRSSALTPVYGLAEATLAVTFSALEEGPRCTVFDRALLASGQAREVAGEVGRGAQGAELSSVGKPVRGFGVEIRDERRRLVAAGEIGAVWVRGPSLMTEYLGLPDETAAVFEDGWLDTGDRGFVHEGELYLCGRTKDVLVLAGRKWAPEPVEAATSAISGVANGSAVAVTRLPEGGDREELWVIAEREVGSARSDAELAAESRRAVLAETGLWPALVVLVAAGVLPRTTSGKLRREESARAFCAGELGDARVFAAEAGSGEAAR